ncbi:MAG: hypothetical protein AB8H03_14480 [Saprospiraceae bacterium]
MSKILQIKEVVRTGDKSDYGYGMTIFNNRLNTAYNHDGKMEVRSYSGSTKYERYEEDGKNYVCHGTKAPALCNYQGKMYLANRETSDNGYSEPVEFSLYMNHKNWDRDNFSSKEMNGVKPETDKGPSMINFNNQMHMVLKMNNHHLMEHCWFDGSKWHWYKGNDKHSIPFTSRDRSDFDTWKDDDTDKRYLQTEQSPALAVVGNKMVCAFKNCGSREGNKPIVTAEFNGRDWSNDVIVKHHDDIIKSELGVGLAYYKGNLWMVYVDPHSSKLKCLYFSNSQQRWRADDSIDRSECSDATISSKSTPTLLPVTVNGQERLALSFADKDENIQLYYLDVKS